MSSLKKNLFLSVFGAAMSASVAFAADLPAPPIIEYEPEVPVEIGSGWYLRGDLGVAVYTGAGGSWVDSSAQKWDFHNESIDNGWLAGIGAGYYFSEHLRGDVTLDYRGKAKYKASAPCGSPCLTSNESVKFSAWTLMLNGYYDFGTWSAITPYVGAGAGLAYLRTTDYATDAAYQTFANKGKVNFAWNVMAGAAFDITDQLKLDTNYRLVSLGKARTGHSTVASQPNPVKFKDLYAHEFRVGLRYDLN
ncbi:outer membrane protein [uncultured Cohaesibacter sp.]|uniref:outer membrane protein n=1 Tax=uncultured Cohaesibacter sp. TaxID=1002546 RepID=UPI0029C970EE|nr:outer membrane protein [uncultured Cohaesibacter sp.]